MGYIKTFIIGSLKNSGLYTKINEKILFARIFGVEKLRISKKKSVRNSYILTGGFGSVVFTGKKLQS